MTPHEKLNAFINDVYTSESYYIKKSFVEKLTEEEYVTSNAWGAIRIIFDFHFNVVQHFNNLTLDSAIEGIRVFYKVLRDRLTEYEHNAKNKEKYATQEFYRINIAIIKEAIARYEALMGEYDLETHYKNLVRNQEEIAKVARENVFDVFMKEYKLG